MCTLFKTNIIVLYFIVTLHNYFSVQRDGMFYMPSHAGIGLKPGTSRLIFEIICFYDLIFFTDNRPSKRRSDPAIEP